MNNIAHTIPANAPRRTPALVIAWTIALALIAFVCIFPFAMRMVAANDDLKFVRGTAYSGTLVENIRIGWTTQANFRPLENIAATLCDPLTLEARSVLIIQFAGLFALFLAMRALVRRLLPDHPIALPVLIIWLLLSPATTLSLWQMDSCSQTWVAAIGAWIGVISLNVIDRARRHQSIAAHVVVFMLLCAIAVNIKELFYGWSAGVGTAIIIAILWLCKRERRAALRSTWLLLPVAVLPALHLLIRLKYSALNTALNAVEAAGDASSSIVADEAARYKVGFGFNVIKNAWVSLLGVFGNGPLHLVKDNEAPLLLRFAPLAALAATFIVLAAAAALAMLHRDPARSGPRRALLLACFGGLASLSITLPMGAVSELYGFGANVASGLLIVAALLSLWHPLQKEEQGMCRAFAGFAAFVLLIVGLYGVASRAYHFDVTWRYTRDLNRIVLEHQRSLPARTAADDREPPARIYFGQPCLVSWLHSQYIIPPILGIGVDETPQWMNKRDPSRPVQFLGPQLVGNRPPRPIDLIVTCEDLPKRKHW